MASKDSLEVRRLLAKGAVGQVADDESIAIRLKANAGTTVTSVTVTTATDVTVITGSGTTVFDFATYTTLGELVDAINAAGEFTARILDGLRTMASANALVDGAVTEAYGYFDLKDDTSSTNNLAYNFSLDRDVPIQKLLGGHRVEIKEIVYNVTLGSSADVKIYQVDSATGRIEKEVFSKAAVSATETTINWAQGIGKISSDDSKELVVVIEGAGSVTGSLTVAGYLI